MGTTKGAIGEVSAVFAGKGNPLCHTLIDNVATDFSKTMDIGLPGPEITPFDGVVEKPVHAVAVILVVLCGVDPPLSGNGVGSSRAVLIAETLYLIAKLSKGRGSGGTCKT